ncbi:MAG: hypothetical protein M3069_20325 [Chloroflexota bacterium]|nr:hypothetical protein [Chloroflexota bacterium]
MATASAYSYAPTIRRPFRLNRRRVLSLGLMIAALLGGLAYLNGVGQQPTYPVLMAAHDLPRGAMVTSNDFQPQRVALPDSMASVAVPAGALTRVVGQRLAEPIHAGVPLLEVQMAGPAELVVGFQRVAFPVGPEHAAGGRLDVGDMVRVYVTTGRGKPDARTTVGLDNAVVSAVGYQDIGLASSGTVGADTAQRLRGKLAWIEVLVEDAHAGEFLQVLAAGDPDVTVLPPTPPASTQVGVVR